MVVRDPSLPVRDSCFPVPREIHPIQEAEKAIFNSLLVQRISNQYGGLPIQIDHVDTRLQELIRSTMQKAVTWSEDHTSSNSSTASCVSSDDVTMEEDHQEDGAPESSAYSS